MYFNTFRGITFNADCWLPQQRVRALGADRRSRADEYGQSGSAQSQRLCRRYRLSRASTAFATDESGTIAEATEEDAPTRSPIDVKQRDLLHF